MTLVWCKYEALWWPAIETLAFPEAQDLADGDTFVLFSDATGVALPKEDVVPFDPHDTSKNLDNPEIKDALAWASSLLPQELEADCGKRTRRADDADVVGDAPKQPRCDPVARHKAKQHASHVYELAPTTARNEEDDVEEESSEEEQVVWKTDRKQDQKLSKQFRRAMIPVLENLGKTSYRVSCGGEASLLSLPGLCIKETPIPIPLEKAGATILRKLGKLSTFGRGIKTLVDENVRNSFEFEAADVKFNNPKWDERVGAIVRKACGNLGLSDADAKRVCYSLWKALYYPTGSFFKAHQDTEKEPGMFATLVLCLPATFEGGELICTHLKESHKHDFGSVAMRPFSAHYACFFADVTHEVAPVTSGDRIVLTYNLTWNAKAASIPRVSFPEQVLTEVKCAIYTHFATSSCAAFFGLEHDYTHKSLSSLGPECLKGRDKVVYNLLKQCTDGTKTEFIFGRREKGTCAYCNEQDGHYFDDYEDELEGYEDMPWEDSEEDEEEDPTVTWECGNIVSETPWWDDLEVEHVMLLPGLEEEWPKNWADHDYEGDLGNEGATRHTTYHTWVLAMVPYHFLKQYE